jgi:ATP-binding cassette subfamily C protein CydD
MRVLRISFLSGFVLELAASLSVALVAVAVGLRLLNGQLDLSVGLFVLLLAPEAFLPLRNVGAGFHAATEGMEAAESAFEILAAATGALDEPAREAMPGSSGERAQACDRPLVFESVTVRYGAHPAVEDFSAAIAPGEVTVLSGPSGSGKSTLLAAALGFVPFDGSITVAGSASAEGRRAGIAWGGQTPGLVAGTVASNVALGAPEPDAGLVEESLRQAVADDVSPSTPLGVGGAGLSGGQAQRVAVARALYRLRASGCGVLMLDEPTSALDRATEARLIESLRAIAHSGVAVLVVSHRDALIDAADRVIRWGAAVHVQ